VVALARITLGVLVRHRRALSLQHSAGDDVRGGDQLDLVTLASELLRDGGGDLGVAGGEGGVEEALVQHPGGPCQTGCGLIAATRPPGEARNDPMAPAFPPDAAVAFRMRCAQTSRAACAPVLPMP